jgi:Na+:H+ antiporter, NhaA family
MSVLRNFLESEAAGGLILMGAAALALIIANSPLSRFYFDTLHTYVFGLSNPDKGFSRD